MIARKTFRGNIRESGQVLESRSAIHPSRKQFIMKIKALLSLAVLALIVAAAWQIGGAEIANLNFREDIRDVAAQAGTHVGYQNPMSEDQVTQLVIQKAGDHGITLAPEQIMVKRLQQRPDLSTWYLAADYTVPVNLGFTTVRLHFTPASERSGM